MNIITLSEKCLQIKTGDSTTISKQDITIIALALENKIELITDDFAVTNVARQLKIQTLSLMTQGIRHCWKMDYILFNVWKRIFKRKRMPHMWK